MPVLVHDHPELVEQEPNNEIAKANALPIPSGISARFAEKNDIDFFRCAGKKGQKLVIQVLTYELNAPTELFLRVLDGKGAELAKSNPQLAGVRLEYSPPADGDFYYQCSDLVLGDVDSVEPDIKTGCPSSSSSALLLLVPLLRRRRRS